MGVHEHVSFKLQLIQLLVSHLLIFDVGWDHLLVPPDGRAGVGYKLDADLHWASQQRSFIFLRCRPGLRYRTHWFENLAAYRILQDRQHVLRIDRPPFRFG
jgi:hypothetical protein